MHRTAWTGKLDNIHPGYRDRKESAVRQEVQIRPESGLSPENGLVPLGEAAELEFAQFALECGLGLVVE